MMTLISPRNINGARRGFDMVTPAGLAVVVESNGDITFTWTARSEYPNFFVRNLNADGSGRALQEGMVNTPSYTFTSAMQTNFYGTAATDVTLIVAEYDPVGFFVGPFAMYSGLAGSLGEAPINLSAVQTSYGDVRMSWQEGGVTVPANAFYHLQILAADQTTVLRTVPLTGVQTYDYLIDQLAADYGFIPEVPYFRVTEVNSSGVAISAASAVYDSVPVLDNSLVQQAFVVMGDATMNAWFNQHSGATASAQAATTFRTHFATAAGLTPIEVLPLNLASDGAAADITCAVGYTATPSAPANYYWDSVGQAPGPLALNLETVVEPLAVPVKGMLWMLSRDALSYYDPAILPEPTPALSLAAHQAIFEYVRYTVGDETLPVYLCPPNAGFSGATPTKTAAGQIAQMTLMLADLCEQDPHTVVAITDVAPVVADFVADPAPNQTTFVQFTPAVYAIQATAMAAAVFNATNLGAAGEAYAYLTLATPPVVTAVGADEAGDITISWQDLFDRLLVVPNAASYAVQIVAIADGQPGALIRDLGAVSATSVVYSAADVTSDFGATPPQLGVSITQTIGSGTASAALALIHDVVAV